MKQFQKMMEQAQQMQEQLEQQMAAMTVEGSSGGGVVKVRMDGRKGVTGVQIQPDAVDPDDVEMLQDLVAAAFNDAARKVDEAVQSQMQGMAGGLPGGMVP